ncbi:MAG: hypothetical protein J7M29_07290 [Verrucomicrobia bacterium]|nr:hypothetical protein [Verrucomicrobiota bacterium]
MLTPQKGRKIREAVSTALALACLGAAGFRAAAQEPANPQTGWTVREPTESEDLFAVPGAGWETFHHTRADDPNLPPWIPSTVAYARWGWGTLEPEPGKIDYAFLEGEIHKAQAVGQQLAFRVMCCSATPGRPYHPEWLEAVGGRVVSCRYRDAAGLEAPDLDDPTVLERHLDFIRRLGARCDGHPGIAHVDLGSVGWRGEWHMSNAKGLSMPTTQTQRRIVWATWAVFRELGAICATSTSRPLPRRTRWTCGKARL